MSDTPVAPLTAEKASELSLLLFASRSFRTRCLIDAKEEILRAGKLSEAQYERALSSLVLEEVRKARILRAFEKETGEMTYGAILDKFSSLCIPDGELIAGTYQLRVEGFLSSRVDEDRVVHFKHVTSDPKSLKPVYVPVNAVDEGKACSGCSMCQAACPVDCIEVAGGKVTIDLDRCIRCGLCHTACPRSFLPKGEFEWLAAGRGFSKEETQVGHFIEAWTARTTYEPISKVKQDGGIASTLLLHALKAGKVQAAIGAAVNGDVPWNPSPLLMASEEDVLKAAGTKYVNTPSLSLLARTGAHERIAVVGTPCMMQALNKARFHPAGTVDVGKVAYRIGIFCMESFTHAGIKHLADKIMGVDLAQVRKMDINMGMFFMYLDEGDPKTAEMKEVGKLARAGCHCCYDLTSEMADVSVGSIGSQPGWNTVLVRTQKGKELFDSAVAAGLIEKRSIEGVKPGMPLLSKLSLKKKRSYESTENKRVASAAYHPLYEMRLWPAPPKKPKPSPPAVDPPTKG